MRSTFASNTVTKSHTEARMCAPQIMIIANAVMEKGIGHEGA